MKMNIYLCGFIALGLTACSSTPTELAQHEPVKTIVTAQDLLHHNWNLISIDGVSVEPKDKLSIPRLEVGEALNSNGYAGCNTFMGKAELQNGRFRIEQLISTMMACDDSEMATENAFITTLSDWGEMTLNEDSMIIQGLHTLEFELNDWKY